MEHYWFVGIWCILQYIGQGRGQSSECSTYTTINDPTRKDTNSGSHSCDNSLQTKWYRFTTSGSEMMPVTCVLDDHCGSAAGGWLSGQHPTVAQGIVTRQVCFSDSGICCPFSNNIRVRNCGQFYVYELKPPPACNLRYCTTDNNECTLGVHNCHQQSSCKNTDGSFNCICKAGYTGNGINCVDNNECTLGTHICHPQAGCKNTDGSFNCTCKAGYTGNGINCVDNNECTLGTHNCHPQASCKNTDGSFNCTCKAGYTGNGINCVVTKAVFCLADRFGISVARNITSLNGISVTLKDTSCIAASNATHYLLSTAFRECGSISNETRDHVVVSNEVLIFDASNGVITRGEKIVIPFACRYKRSDLEASLKSFQPTINSSIHAREDGFGNFTLNINMAHNARFDSYYISYPVNARVNDRLFIQVSLNANSTDFVLLIDECYTTPTQNKNDATKFSMIEKMCPTDSTLQFHSGEMHHKKFSFLAFNFLNNVETIYLHCGVYLCHKSSKVARCTSGCGINKIPSRKKRDVHKREIDDPDYTSTYVLDTGAIRKAKENKGNKGASLSSVSTTTIVLGVAVGIFCLLSVSFIIVKTIKRKRANYIKRKQSQTALSFGKQGMDNKAVEKDPCT